MGFIIVVLDHRLGNQIFVMAAAFALSKKLGKTMTIHKNMGSNNTYWDTIFKWVPGAEVLKGHTYLEFDIVNDANFKDYYEGKKSSENLKVTGMFQNPKYIKEYSGEFTKLISSDISYVKPSKNLRIAVHVRRGDFKILQDFNMLPLSYFTRTMEFMVKYFHPKPLTFLVFSDDLEWCKTNFPKNCEFYEGKQTEEDFWAMSQCDHHIISNSSFSWWAAFIADNNNNNTKKHIVLAPKYWYNVDKFKVRETYPTHWYVF